MSWNNNNSNDNNKNNNNNKQYKIMPQGPFILKQKLIYAGE